MMTEAEFWARIDYEGGVESAIEYGLKPQECEPGALRDAYQEVWRLYHDTPMVDAFTRLNAELARVEEGMGW